jgi:hypothetical protein
MMSSVYIKTTYNPIPPKSHASSIFSFIAGYVSLVLYTVAVISAVVFGLPITNFTSEFEYREIVMLSIAGCFILYVLFRDVQ